MGGMTANGGKRRVLGYDALRVVAMCAVVGIHACMTARGFAGGGTGTDSGAGGSAVAALDSALHFTVPLLVFLSGILVWGRPFARERGAYVRFMRRRLTRVGLPYLAWFVLYAVAALLLPAARTGWLQDVPRDAAHIGELLLRLLSGRVWYHLYFVPMLLTLYAMAPVVDRMLRWRRWCPELLVVVTLVIKVGLFPAVNPWMQTQLQSDVYAWLVHLLVHLPHMMLGAWVAIRWGELITRTVNRLSDGDGSPDRPDSAATDTAGDTAAAALFLLQPKRWLATLKYPVLLLFMIAVAVALEPVWRRIERPLTRLSALSFGVYFVHPLLLVAAQALLPAHARVWAGLLPVLGLWAVLLVVSFVLSAGLARFRATRWLIGE